MFSGVPMKKRTRCSPQKRVVAIPEPVDDDKKKKKETIDDDQIGLQVKIFRAEGIDPPRRYPFVLSRNYNVVYWVKPGEELHTNMAGGMTPKWNHKSTILLENVDDVDNGFLNLEVQRLNSETDPGTSCGRVVVGRVRIPIPDEFDRRKRGSFPLMRNEGIGQEPEGHIVVSMSLKRIRRTDSSRLCVDGFRLVSND